MSHDVLSSVCLLNQVSWQVCGALDVCGLDQTGYQPTSSVLHLPLSILCTMCRPCLLRQMLELLRFVHALQALPSQATIVSPAALLRHISSTRAAQDGPGGQEEPWNQDLLQALLAAIYKVPKRHPKLHACCSGFTRRQQPELSNTCSMLCNKQCLITACNMCCVDVASQCRRLS